MKKHELFISLGHNSSAMLAVDDVIVVGYEQERIDRIKSSSAYPKAAIERCLSEARVGHVDCAYVSHWFDHFELAPSKYIDTAHLRSVAGDVVSLSPDFTHHDAHAGSAVAFVESYGGFSGQPAYIVVLDGFGSLQECFSVYCYVPGHSPVRLHRTYGYSMSLGLMYQYATEFLGMKPNQDEYKLLGYEAHILNYVTAEQARSIKARVQLDAVLHANDMLRATVRPKATDSLIDYGALSAAKEAWFERARSWRAMFAPGDDPRANRVFVAFCAQAFIEAAVGHMLDVLLPVNVERLALVGGCFLNVKLNRTIQNRPGRPFVFAHPLAGDQGAALGLSSSVAMKHLNVGRRAIARTQPDMFEEVENLVVVGESKWPAVVGDLVDAGYIVNVLRGDMEYGPRALCNTTTFARPTVSNVRKINLLNNRDDAMPMAPVMTPEAAGRILRDDELSRLVISDSYMITTVAFRSEPTDQLMGVAHRDPLDRTWTARPQVVRDDEQLTELLRGFDDETLINTSYNYHGEPIIMTAENAVRTHSMQCSRARMFGERLPVTVLVQS